MPRKHKSIEEQLADAQAKQAQLKARLHTLETRKRQRDSKTRGKAQQTLMRVVLDQMANRPDFKSTIAELVQRSPLRPDEQDAIAWLLSSLDQPSSRSAEDQADTGATVPAKAQNVA